MSGDITGGWIPKLLSLVLTHQQRGLIHVNGENFSNYDHLHCVFVLLVSHVQRLANNNIATVSKSSDQLDYDYGWSVLNI